MAHEAQNTLYVTSQGASLRLDHDTVRVVSAGETMAQLPLVNLGAIFLFGRIGTTTPLIHRCAEDGIDVVWLTRGGRFRGRLSGRTTGNVLLRRAQHRALDENGRPLSIARQFVAGKIRNARFLLMRAARDQPHEENERGVREAAARLDDALTRLPDARDLDELRGEEGHAARAYFRAFGFMIRATPALVPHGRSRQPPRDRANALLSFLYALLRAECESALEGVGLDPQIGYLHALRPGRPALALDLMEELRPAFADRLALRLINRGRVRTEHFETTPGGAVSLTGDGRRLTLDAWSRYKESTAFHRLLERPVPAGLVPHVQARVLARHLRGDLRHYMPHLVR